MPIIFKHVVNKSLAADYRAGNVQTIHYGNLRNAKATLLSTFWHTLNKGECRREFGRPSALNTEYEGRPDIHIFETMYRKQVYSLILFADSAKSGKGSAAEIVSNKEAGYYYKVMEAFLDYLRRTARIIKPLQYAQYARVMRH